MTIKRQLSGPRPGEDRVAFLERRLTRRNALKYGAAGTAATVAALYVSPVIHTAHATSHIEGTPTTTGGSGCTPGYWKNHDNWPAYTDNPNFYEVFDDVSESAQDTYGSLNKTFEEVMKQGGGCEKALGRHAVAGLLNAAALGSSYGMTSGQIITAVTAALNAEETSCDQIETLKKDIEALNEAGCPLGKLPTCEDPEFEED